MQEHECRALLTALLTDSGAQWEQHGIWTRLRLQQDGMLWELACRCQKDSILLYSRFPMTIAQAEKGFALCSTINAALPRGAVFIAEQVPTLRVFADMSDIYDARERLAQAIEYSASVMTHFWGQLQTVCQHT